MIWRDEYILTLRTDLSEQKRYLIIMLIKLHLWAKIFQAKCRLLIKLRRLNYNMIRKVLTNGTNLALVMNTTTMYRKHLEIYFFILLDMR